MLKKISVITINYNNCQGLIKTYDSLRIQLDLNTRVEWIVVDGNSTDGSVDFLNSISSEIDKLIVRSVHAVGSSKVSARIVQRRPRQHAPHSPRGAVNRLFRHGCVTYSQSVCHKRNCRAACLVNMTQPSTVRAPHERA